MATLLNAAGPEARVVLAGGGTPRPVYERLARDASVDWTGIRVTFSDERAVPPGHPDSNYGMIRRALLDPAGVPEDHVLRFPGELPVPAACDRVNAALRSWAARSPLFDLVVLGLGADAHTASLFPGAPAPPGDHEFAIPARHPDGSERVSLAARALADSRWTVFLATGMEKSRAVADSLFADETDARYPARRAAGPDTLWILDSEAASGLSAS
jgi:6-phosphogluconolactonase